MHLSISSSNDRLPERYWLPVWIVIGILLSGFILFFEINIRSNGWEPSFSDSVELWSYHRKRASSLADKGLILVGESRLQLGLDLEEIRKITELEPVQLAIDGSSPVPVLAHLANDPAITGTILFSFSEDHIKPDYTSEKSADWIKYYEKNFNNGKMREPYKIVNNNIQMFLESIMVTRIDGARPYTVIKTLAFRKAEWGNYIVTHQDRSRDADYSKVKMPDFYVARVGRHLGPVVTPEELTINGLLSAYTIAVNELQPLNNQEFIKGIKNILEYSRQIEDRGGKVIIVRMPVDKLVREIDDRRYPRELFWSHLEKQHDKVIHYEDYPALSRYQLPDGSHLDYRDKETFTRELMDILLRDYLTE